MPIYEYRCGRCKSSFETFVRPGHAEDAECPRCHGRQLSREMSTFATRASDSNGSASASGCGGCTSTSCAGCGVH
jgi:putative FmdB family regulatory protein